MSGEGGGRETLQMQFFGERDRSKTRQGGMGDQEPGLRTSEAGEVKWRPGGASRKRKMWDSRE